MRQRSAITDYLADIGRKGGQAKVPKGFAALSEEDRRKVAMKAVRAKKAKAKK